MKNFQEAVEIEVELDSELLYKIKIIADRLGTTPEEYISSLIRQYVASHQ